MNQPNTPTTADTKTDKFDFIEFGPDEPMNLTLTMQPNIKAASADENLAQIQDNSQAIEAITTMLNSIVIMQTQDPCEHCKDWQVIVSHYSVVTGLYQGLHAISRYSDFLAEETKKGITSVKEEEPADQEAD